MTDKIFNFADELKPRNIMTESDRTAAQKDALAMLDRMDKEKEDLQAQSLVIDGTNKIKFLGYPYAFEAQGEQIIVSIDIFKSGYECKVCDGKRKIKYICSCERNGNGGFKYNSTDLTTLEEVMGTEVANARSVIKCPECEGDYISRRQEITCTACNGTGALLILPKSAEKLPQHGTVVSIGQLAQRLIKEESWGYKIGDRVLWSEYSGKFLPLKAGVLIKVLDYNQVIARIDGAESLDSFDFIMTDKD